MGLLIGFALLIVLSVGEIDAAMHLAVSPNLTVNAGEIVSITCSTGNADAKKIEVYFAGTKCNRGCEKVGRGTKCNPINEGCSLSDDFRTITIRVEASEIFDARTFRCSTDGMNSKSATLKVNVPPIIEALSLASRVVIGTEATLFCQIRSIADTSVQWLRDETVLETMEVKASQNRLRSNATYLLNAVSDTLAGSYYCAVSLSSEPQVRVVSRAMRVVVVDSPSGASLKCQSVGTFYHDIDQKPIYQVGESIRCSCEAFGAPESVRKVTFYKSIYDTTRRNFLKTCEDTVCELTYTVEQEDVSASISCGAENEATVLFNNTVMSNEYGFSLVRRPHQLRPWIKIVDADTIEIDEQSTHVVECGTTGEAAPAVTLQLFQGENLFAAVPNCSHQQYPSGRETQCTWFLSSVDTTREFNGLYFCRGTQLDAFEDSDRIHIRFEPRSVSVSPKSTKPYKEEEIVKLECAAESSNPPKNVSWSRNGEPYFYDIVNEHVPGDSNGVVAKSVLTMEALRGSDVEFACHVDGTDLRDSVTVSVNHPPDVKIYSNKETALLDDEIVLTCNASDGKPDVGSSANVDYVWERLKEDNGRWTQLDTDDEILQISKATAFDSALYRCTVIVEESGRNFATYSLQIKHKPILGSPQPARIVLDAANCEDSDAAAPEQSRVCARISMHIVSEPPLSSCWWERAGVRITLDDEERLKPEENSTHCMLLIRSTNADTGVLGSYTLVAENEVGRSNFSAKVQLPGPPDKPTNLVVKKRTPSSCTVEWTSGYSGGSPQTFIVNATRTVASSSSRRQILKEVLTTSQSVDDRGFGTTITAKLRPLDSDSVYEIAVKAVNRNPSASESAFETVLCKTTVLPKVSGSLEKTGSTAGVVLVKFRDQKTLNLFRLMLHYCNKTNTEACSSVPITAQVPVPLGIPLQFEDLIKQFSFELRVFDDEDLIVNVTLGAASAATVREKVKQQGMQTEVLIGIAVGGIFVAILFITCTIFMLRRKHSAHENSSRGARRSSSDDDQNQSNKLLTKDNGLMKPASPCPSPSPRPWTEPTRRAPPSGGGNYSIQSQATNNHHNNNGSNNHSARNANQNRANDCEMTEFDSKQPLMKAHDAECEVEDKLDIGIDLKSELQKLNPAFDAEKQHSTHDDILDAVFSVKSGKVNEDEVVIEIPKNVDDSRAKVAEADVQQIRAAPAIQMQAAPEQPKRENDVPPPAPARKPRLGTLPPPNTLSEASQPPADAAAVAAAPTQAAYFEDVPRPPPRKPKKMGTSLEESELETSHFIGATSPMCATENGVSA